MEWTIQTFKNSIWRDPYFHNNLSNRFDIKFITFKATLTHIPQQSVKTLRMICSLFLYSPLSSPSSLFSDSTVSALVICLKPGSCNPPHSNDRQQSQNLSKHPPDQSFHTFTSLSETTRNHLINREGLQQCSNTGKDESLVQTYMNLQIPAIL